MKKIPSFGATLFSVTGIVVVAPLVIFAVILALAVFIVWHELKLLFKEEKDAAE